MSDNKTSLVDITGLSQPATKLIERVSDALGGGFKPWQVKRVARAEAEAAQILAASDLQITDMQARGLERLIVEGGKQQENMERMTAQAAQQVENDTKPEDIEEDWLTNFFDKARNYSDTEMQSLWAKILAGEATTPGAFSRRTVNQVSDMDRSDAQLFTKVCTFIWTIDDTNTLLVFDVKTGVYKSLSYMDLTHLDDIGFLDFHVDPSASFGFSIPGDPRLLVADYYGRSLVMEKVGRFNFGRAMLTETGKQLATICGSALSSEFYEYVIERWANEGLNPTPVPTNHTS